MKKTMLVNLVLFLFFTCLMGFQPVLAETQKKSPDSKPLKIAWFSTMAKETKTGRLKQMHTDFWPTTSLFVQAAAEDLDIEMDIYYANANFVLLLDQVETVLSNPKTRPDGIIFHNWKGDGEKILRIAEKYGVKSFIFNAGFKEGHPVGSPRAKYKHWIGQMYPDDEYAGYLLAKNLIQAAKKLPNHKKQDALGMVALEGNRMSEASNLRTKGLKRALGEHKEAELHQYFHSKWSRKLGGNAFLMTRQRFPEANVFWAASESMSIGVIEEASKQGWAPGRDFVTGGVDLLPLNYEYVADRKMSVSIGGHYLEGAWALIVLHDYLKGLDFKDRHSVTINTKMVAVSGDNIEEYGDLARLITPENVSRIDFKKYSRFFNPGLSGYRFPTGEVLKLLKK